MAAKIDFLIDKQDNFQIVRNKIGLILAEEIAAQKVLALADGKDPALWDANVFIERANPWQLLEDGNGKVLSETPLVNVYYNSGDFPMSKGDVVERQTQEGVFHIDIFAAKNNLEVSGVHTSGDLRASLEADRIIKLIRNILMSSFYVFLDLRGVVGKRWIQSIEKFQPAIGDRPSNHIMGARIVFNVEFNEFSPQIEGVDLEGIDIELNTSDRGQVLLEYDF